MTLEGEIVCSVCGQDWMRGWNHSIWCGGFGAPHGKPVEATHLSKPADSDAQSASEATCTNPSPAS